MIIVSKGAKQNGNKIQQLNTDSNEIGNNNMPRLTLTPHSSKMEVASKPSANLKAHLFMLTAALFHAIKRFLQGSHYRPSVFFAPVTKAYPRMQIQVFVPAITKYSLRWENIPSLFLYGPIPLKQKPNPFRKPVHCSLHRHKSGGRGRSSFHLWESSARPNESHLGAQGTLQRAKLGLSLAIVTED